MPEPEARAALNASMGPQLYRCGNLHSFVYVCVSLIASMGPQLYRCGNVMSPLAALASMDLLQWGRNFIVAETIPSVHTVRHRHNASMGPQLYRCGNRAVWLSLPFTPTSLQWGRNFIVAETLPADMTCP